MTIDAEQLKVGLRRFASRQKQKLIYRAINPARYLVDLARVGLERNSVAINASAGPIRVALITDRDAYTSDEQFTPFSEFRSDLRNKLRLVSMRFLLQDVLSAPKCILSCFDVIGLKMSYRTTPSEALDVVRTVRNAVKNKCIFYFDGDDDLCIQWPEFFPTSTFISKNTYFAIGATT